MFTRIAAGCLLSLLCLCAEAAPKYAYAMMLTTRTFKTEQLCVVLCDNHYNRTQSPNGTVWNLPGGQMNPGETPDIATVRELNEELHQAISIDHLYNMNAVYTMGGHIVHVVGDETCMNWSAMPPVSRPLPPGYKFPAKFTESGFNNIISTWQTNNGPRPSNYDSNFEVTKVKFLKLKRLLEWFQNNDIDRCAQGQPVLVQDLDASNTLQDYWIDYWCMYTLQKAVMTQNYSWSARGWLTGINDPVARKHNKTLATGVSILPQCELHSYQGHLMNNMIVKTMPHKGSIIRIEHDGVTTPDSCILRIKGGVPAAKGRNVRFKASIHTNSTGTIHSSLRSMEDGADISTQFYSVVPYGGWAGVDILHQATGQVLNGDELMLYVGGGLSSLLRSKGDYIEFTDVELTVE
ncbi:NUDIX hydrolase [Endozoicomonadaceae bacterium StTr2]